MRIIGTGIDEVLYLNATAVYHFFLLGYQFPLYVMLVKYEFIFINIRFSN